MTDPGRARNAEAPNQLWVTDLTYVATWAGMAYVCLIIDAFSRRIVGWRVASHMRTTMVLDALEMARWSRGIRLEGLIAHSDAGSQFTSIRYGERLAELGAIPSVGSIGDSFDNALAETVIGLYKTELVRGPNQGPWRTIDELEVATLSSHPSKLGSLQENQGDSLVFATVLTVRRIRVGDPLKRVAALSGVLYVVLVVLGTEVLGGGGGEAGVTATRAEIASDLSQNPPTTTEWAGLYIEVIGLLFFVVFIAVLWSTLRAAEGSGGVFSAVVFGAGLLSAGIKLASLPAGAAALYRADEGFDPEVAAALIDMNNASFVLTWGINALMLAAVALIVLRTAALPRWVGWSAAVLSLGLLVGMAFATSEFVLPFLLTLIWIVAVSVLLFRRGSSLVVAVS